MSKNLNGLYVITDNKLTPDNSIITQIEEALKGGAKIVQLRDKQNSDSDIKNLVITIQNLCRKYNAQFILNDRIDLAIELKCDGLHIGKSDYHRVEEVRKKFSGCLGISCYGDIETAKIMEKKDVDYVAFGAFFASSTKPNAKLIDKDIIKEAKKVLDIPICAIGGITISNVDELKNNGIDMVAVISDIWKNPNIEKICNSYKNIMEEK